MADVFRTQTYLCYGNLPWCWHLTPKHASSRSEEGGLMERRKRRGQAVAEGGEVVKVQSELQGKAVIASREFRI